MASDTSRLQAHDDLVRLLEDTQNTTLEEITDFKIDQETYLAIADRLDCFLRQYDYDPGREALTIRMATPLHEGVKVGIVECLNEQLKSLASRPGKTGEYASRIRHGGSSRILLCGSLPQNTRLGTMLSSVVRHPPDAQFHHRDARYPGVVIEVSYSQNGKYLKRLAKDYILRSKGNVKVVIGVDVGYRHPEATVSCWRAQLKRVGNSRILKVHEEIVKKPFRSSKGVAVNQRGRIVLKLSDFSTDAIPCDDEPAILEIPFRQLLKVLKMAEAMQQKQEGPNLGIAVTDVEACWSSSSDSEDELSPDDEDKFLKLEAHAEKKVDKLDEDFELNEEAADSE
ncbi:hypothetical protein B0I35DRAFT_464967 [Stachybotrys elegans]|uniref:Uncharacterized protein n=1 Tax=Stachybotrys elegans TaxID=80388 RepID=A0A8K0WLQ8_9HYPO|nr:hypothetical protein B0I35DRAFT_464967 [Stachybotrys elegans]